MRWMILCLLALAGAEASGQQLQWSYRESTDPMTDAVRMAASSLARRGNDVHQIEVACEESRIYAMIYFGQRVVLDVSSGDISVMVRWDEEPAMTETWHGASTGSAAFVPSEGAQSFARSVLARDRLRVRARAVGGRLLDAEFETRGAAPHVSRVLAGCGA